ncbi:MAG: hypothetical protein FJX74_22335 [Armatimonadetes bacterium]|nr:hypothetical protein [Armatimonadota bacterium]
MVRRQATVDRLCLAVLLWCLGGPGVHGQEVLPGLDLDAAIARLGEEQQQQTPRGGRWVLTYRERGRPVKDEVVFWDSEGPERYGPYLRHVPSWLRLALTCRAEGLVDGAGQPYSGPLLAKVSGPVRIAGPYPEGFVCVVNGACEIVVVPTVEPFTQAPIGLTVSHRSPPAFLEWQGRRWPTDPDYYLDLPQAETGLTGWAMQLAGVNPAPEGFRMSPVRSEVVAGQRVLFADAVYSMAGGRPAHRLPARAVWKLLRADGGPLPETVHELEATHEGRVADTLQVPAEQAKGSVWFWHREAGPDYVLSSGQEFDFSKPPAPQG